MPNTGFVMAGVEWIFAISFLLVVIIFCFHHVCAFWAACSKAKPDSNNHGKVKAELD